MTVIAMKDIKKRYHLSYEEVAAGSKVPIGTVQKVLGGITDRPRKSTIDRLTRYFEAIEDQHAQDWRTVPVGETEDGYIYRDEFGEETVYPIKDMIAPDGSFIRQGTYTTEDRDRLPDQRRTELIDGVLYDMASPSTRHQDILGELFVQIYNCIHTHGKECKVYVAPLDVMIDRDNKSALQPDILVVCHSDRITEKNIQGAPDLAIEILSPSTWRKDLEVKTVKYHRSGVRELWLVNPRAKTVTVCYYDAEKDPDSMTDPTRIYRFDEKIPIAISDEGCTIDLSMFSENAATSS